MTTIVDQQKQFPLTVTLTAMNDRTRALIEFYIEHSGEQFFRLTSSAETPDALIVDYDHEGCADILASSSWRSDLPIIVLAFEVVQVARAIMVKKPPDSDAFQAAAITALEQINRPEGSSESHDNSEQLSELPLLDRTVTAVSEEQTDTPAYFRTSDASLPGKQSLSTQKKIQRYLAKVELLCGPETQIEDWQNHLKNQPRFDPALCLSQRLSRALSDEKPGLKAVKLSLPNTEIYALPTLDKIYTTVSLEYRNNVQQIFREWQDSEIQVRKYYKNDVNEVVDVLNQSKRYVFGTQSFNWLSALFSAHGRLPVGFDIKHPYHLMHWPNMTRLELIPDCIEIAAAWADNHASLEQIIERVGCEPRYAVSFFNAASAIELMNVGGADEH